MVLKPHGEIAPEVPTRLTGQVHGYALSVIAAGVLLAILYLGRVVFITAMTAIIIALILEPFVGLLVRFRLPRSIASFFVGLFGIAVIYLVGLGAWNQLAGLAGDAPAFRNHLSSFITGVSGRIQHVEDSTRRFVIPEKKPDPEPPPRPAPKRSRKSPASEITLTPPGLAPGAIQEVRIHQDSNPLTAYVYAHLGTVYEFVLMASFVPFLVYFMLSWRDHFYRSFLRFFDGADRLAAARSLEGVATMARAFVVGNFLIGVLLAALSWAAFAIIHLPYPFLIAVFSGFLSLVPYVGIPLALLPPILAAVAGGDPSSVILFAIVIVLMLHLIAMNVLYPKLVGGRVHLNPLVVTFSLMFWGFLWDAPGLILAIPITAALKAVCDNVEGLQQYGRFLGD
ncbi:MAG TPA: AI-2E family transporter [Bryobacteraceae bacterium]|jgi:predicted PurR-regulated permease PerM|nr:AI-2E family transporter [Bryobacteraceae bacterium]